MSARAKRVLLAVVSLGLLLVGGSVYAAFAAPSKPDIALQVAPASQSVARGQSANYTLTVTPLNGFSGSVTLSASGLPSGATANFTPSPVPLTSGTSSTAGLQVSVGASAPVGSYTLTISGTGGSGGNKVSSSVTAGLTVNYPLSRSLSMTATPSSVTMSPGAFAAYTIQTTRSNLTGSVTFGVISGLPSGATAKYTSTTTSGSTTTTTLQVSTSPTTPDGTYDLYLISTDTEPDGSKYYAYAHAGLTVSTQGRAFTISGDVSGLAPGVSQPLDLVIYNPNNKDIAVSNLSVAIQAVSAQGCSTADYAVDQYSGPYPLTIPSGARATLSGLNVGQQYWPHIRMLDRPVNQDACKGATLTLAYSGSGQGS